MPQPGIENLRYRRSAHCMRMGQILADIHGADVQVDGMEIEKPDDENRDWKHLIFLCRDDEWN